MATKTFEELKQLAIQIRDEKTNKQNTATRVGTAMLEHINKLEQDYYDKTQTDEELKERDDKLTELSNKEEEIGNFQNSIFGKILFESDWLIADIDNPKWIKDDDYKSIIFSLKKYDLLEFTTNAVVYISKIGDFNPKNNGEVNLINHKIRYAENDIVRDTIGEDCLLHVQYTVGETAFKQFLINGIDVLKGLFTYSGNTFNKNTLINSYRIQSKLFDVLGFNRIGIYKEELTVTAEGLDSYISLYNLVQKEGLYEVTLKSDTNFIGAKLISATETGEGRLVEFDFKGLDLKDGYTVLIKPRTVNQRLMVYADSFETGITSKNVTIEVNVIYNNNLNILDLRNSITDWISEFVDKQEILSEEQIYASSNTETEGNNVIKYELTKGVLYELDIQSDSDLSETNLLESDVDGKTRTTLYILNYVNLKEGIKLLFRPTRDSGILYLYTRNEEKYSTIPVKVSINKVSLVEHDNGLKLNQNHTESYKIYSNLQALNCGHVFNTRKGNFYIFKIRQSHIICDANILIADKDGNNRYTALAGVDKQQMLDGTFEMPIIAPFDNMQVLVYYVDNNEETVNILRTYNPYVEISMYEKSSDEVLLLKNQIANLKNGFIGVSNINSHLLSMIATKEAVKNGYIEYDVCIIGGGSAGIGAAAALIKNGISVCIVDKQKLIGGTFTNAWINCCAACPDNPFFREIAKEMLQEGNARYVDTYYQNIVGDYNTIDYKRSLLRTQFMNQSEVCITFDIDAYVSKINQKLSGVTMFLESEFKNATKEGQTISEIEITDKLGNNVKIKAKVFIDCSGDSVLIRNVNTIKGVDYFIGTDNTDTYSSWGITEPHAFGANENDLNPPTLMFRTKEGEENLNAVSTEGLNYYLNPYYYPDASKKYIYANSSSFLTGGDSGTLVVNNGEEYVIEQTVPKIMPYWKYTKENGISSSNSYRPAYVSNGVKYQKFDSIAKMLGIRETYRVACERMLSENDIHTAVSAKAMEVDNVLDLPIAIGNHVADIHGKDMTEINKNLKPYFIKYGSIVPKGLDNVLVASRGAGFTNIAASSVRLNKSIMSLGYAAGCAAYYIVNGLNNKSVPKDYLLKDTNIENTTKDVLSIFVE